MSRVIDTDVLVIGSGPGGATTAALLAEAGQDVLLVEEGSRYPVDSSADHSLAQMDEKWRSGGLTAALGKPKITYIEGRCVGGASETNAGLYHRPFPDVLERWAQEHGVVDMGADALAPWLDAVEQEIGVTRRPGGPGPASAVLAAGADAMGWRHTEIQRFWRYVQREDGSWGGERRSMTETMIPRALAAGCRLLSDCRVDRLQVKRGRALSASAGLLEDGRERQVQIRFSRVWVCAGAVQTPRLLRKSGLTAQVGDTLTMNPMIRVAARFPEPVNVPALGVPVVQIEEFKPAMTLGCSYSAVPHLAMWLDGSAADRSRMLEDWERMAVFYVKVSGKGRGSVRTWPVFDEALVRQPVTGADIAALGEGLCALSQALFAAGAQVVHNPLLGGKDLTRASEAEGFRGALSPANISVSAIHLHSTVPMGERPGFSATDSFGRLHQAENIQVNDSSLLPSSPGVNPQGTIMAIARRNIAHALEQR
jgi:choline dehydrogenase-like flavoprotein